MIKFLWFLLFIVAFFDKSASNASDGIVKVEIGSMGSPYCTSNLNLYVENGSKIKYSDNLMMNWIFTAERIKTENRQIFQLRSPHGLMYSGIMYFEISDPALKNHNGDPIIFTKNGSLSQVHIQTSQDKIVSFLTDYECMMHDGTEISRLIMKHNF